MAGRTALTITVVGAGMVGLTTAVLLARDGHQVTVLETDPAAPPESAEAAWSGWQRPGVNQLRQPHVMLPRWTHEISRELPELLELLTAMGGTRVNMLHLQPESVTHGWKPGDEQLDTLTARRPVLEASLGRLAADEPRVSVRRGTRATGLVARTEGAVPQVHGVSTSTGTVHADLVVDAAGRRTPVPGWVRALGGPAPAESREPSGFVYHGRHYRSPDGRTPGGHGSALTHHPSLSVLTLPCDAGTYCVVLVASSQDRALRVLHEEAAWEAAAACSPVAAPWVRHGTPITPLRPIAGIEDVARSYARDGRPVVTGLVAVGDSSSATNPSLGRGTTIGTLQAIVLRDVLARPAADPLATAQAFHDATAAQVTPWVEATLRFDRHRLAEIDADVAGVPYATDDRSWAMSTALMNGAAHDPVLARASARIAGLLASPLEVLSDPAVQQRLQPWTGGPRYPIDGPTREEVLQAVATATHAVTAQPCTRTTTPPPRRTPS